MVVCCQLQKLSYEEMPSCVKLVEESFVMDILMIRRVVKSETLVVVVVCVLSYTTLEINLMKVGSMLREEI